jgi:hypothetical protein
MSFKGDNSDVIDFNASQGAMPGLKFNPANILHGEEYLEVNGAVPTAGRFIQKTRVLDFLDKGKGGLLLMEQTYYPESNPNGPYVAKIIRSSFIRGLGGHGRKKLVNDPRPRIPKVPKRAPDAMVARQTLPTQALIYRLSGDFNPLHIDVNIAKMVGFERPILHGLCSFGFAVNAVLRSFPNVAVKSVSCRFSSPVLPGQELVTHIWKEGAEWLLFEVYVGKKQVLGGGAVQIAAAKL